MDKIYLENVSYIYSEGTPFEQRALENVTLGIKEKRITGIIGHTGSGKSTMMQLLNGLSKPTAGKVFLDGFDINSQFKDVFPAWLSLPEYSSLSRSAAKKAIKAELKKRQRELCFRVGLVMQYPEYQLFEETVYRDIAYGPSNMELSPEEIDARVREAAAFTGVEADWLQKSPFDLSGGQKRRVAIAGVMAMKPDVLVLDEPAAGLDPRGRRLVFQTIQNYRRQTDSTVIIVSHSMEDMAQYCDDVVVLADARVILSGNREEVFSHTDQLEQVGLDIPQVTQLIRLLRSKGLALPENIYTVDTATAALCQLLEEKK